MSAINTGGYAFPDPCPDKDNCPGMTLRDWFAGQSILVAGMLCQKDPGVNPSAEELAKAAYKIADALLKER